MSDSSKIEWTAGDDGTPGAGAARIAGTDHAARIRIDGARAVLEFAREALVQARESGRFGLAQVQVGK